MSNKKIVCRLFGGIGNQLFIYATARRFALELGADLYIDDTTGFDEDRLYRREFSLSNFTTTHQTANRAQKLEPFSPLRRKIARLVSTKLSPSLNGYVYNPYIDFREKYNSLPNRQEIYLEGYWQSYRYFECVREQLQRELKIVPPEDQANLEMATRMSSRPSTAVHMRFFDSNNTPHTKNWEEYYRSASRIIGEQRGKSHFYVFSDAPDKARSFSEKLWKESFTIVSINDVRNSAFADMWLMSCCDNIIIADSTFSWWGAWFNASPQKLVISPRHSLSGRDSAWNVKTMIPEDWILV